MLYFLSSLGFIDWFSLSWISSWFTMTLEGSKGACWACGNCNSISWVISKLFTLDILHLVYYLRCRKRRGSSIIFSWLQNLLFSLSFGLSSNLVMWMFYKSIFCESWILLLEKNLDAFKYSFIQKLSFL